MIPHGLWLTTTHHELIVSSYAINRGGTRTRNFRITTFIEVRRLIHSATRPTLKESARILHLSFNLLFSKVKRKYW